jgi:pSer/pThr/pTyr-binding forkhead associated (FHA) protein
MELRYQDRLILVDQSRPTLTIGRQSYNDLVIEDYCVSRSHARINYRRGQFLLTDQSTNGTYLLIHGEAPAHLKRDQAILYGSGLFSPGRELLPDSPTLIYFTVKL